MRLLLLFAALSSASLFAQTVPEVQKPLLTKVTATWCPPCGSWGWDLFDDLVTDNENSAILLASHYRGSDLETTAGNELATNFGVSGQPSFYLGNVRQSATSGTVATARADIKSEIDNSSTTSPVANAATNAIFNDPSNFSLYTFETTTTFFQDASGEYSLSVYAVEDNVVNAQASRGADAVHKRVLRGVVSGENTFGEPVVSGNVSAGQSFTSTFMYEFPVEWNFEDLHLVSVLWKKNSDSYEFVNANEVGPEGWISVISVEDILSADDYRITGFGESGILTSTLELTNEASGVIVELFDTNGRQLSSRLLGNVPSGKTQVRWGDTPLSSGVYAVRLSIDNRSITKTVFVE